jgi:kynureninase
MADGAGEPRAWIEAALVSAFTHRDQFHVPGPGAYALTHSVGCLPKRSSGALQANFLQPWQQQGGDAWPTWLAVIEGFRASLAALLGGSPADYCPQANLSSGLAKLLPALPPSKVRTVLLAAEDSFPSLAFVLERAGRLGLSLRLMSHARDPADLTSWADALTADVAAALVTHVHSNSGAVAPATNIATLCRERGILSIVDVAQSAGILPISIPELGADVVLGSCIKWLCGGPGAGFMWIDPALVQSLEPSDVGWFSHADPFEFDVHSFEYAADARRFWGGTPSVIPYTIAAESLRVLADIGVAAVRSHSLALMDVFRSELPAAWRGSIALERIGGTLCLPLGQAREALAHALSAKAVRLDYRGPVARLSFHIYNTAAEAADIAHCWSGL